MTEEYVQQMFDFIKQVVEKQNYIQILKNRIETGPLEHNLSKVIEELLLLSTNEPDSMELKYQKLWIAFNYFLNGDEGLKTLRTVNNILIDRLPMGNDQRQRLTSQKMIIEFLLSNNIYSKEELVEVNEYDSITGSKAVQFEKKVITNNKPNASKLPEELQTEKAKALFQKAIEKGFIIQNNTSFTWNGSRPELAFFAELASEYLNTTKFKPFEMAFGVNNLAQEAYKTREERGSLKRQKEIESLFKQ